MSYPPVEILATSVVGQTVVCSEAETNARGSVLCTNILQGESGMVCTRKRLSRLLMQKRAVLENEYEEETGVAVLVRRGGNIRGDDPELSWRKTNEWLSSAGRGVGEEVLSDTIVGLAVET